MVAAMDVTLKRAQARKGGKCQSGGNHDDGDGDDDGDNGGDNDGDNDGDDDGDDDDDDDNDGDSEKGGSKEGRKSVNLVYAQFSSFGMLFYIFRIDFLVSNFQARGGGTVRAWKTAKSCNSVLSDQSHQWTVD